MREASVVRFRGFYCFGCGVGFALTSPVGGALDADQRAPSDRHLARAKAQVPHFEIHGLRDAVREAKFSNGEGRLIGEWFTAGDLGAGHVVVSMKTHRRRYGCGEFSHYANCARKSRNPRCQPLRRPRARRNTSRFETA